MLNDDRTAFINGLRDLATFLETHADLPLPNDATLYYFSQQDGDAAQCAEIDRVADILGSTIREADISYGHYGAARWFGPVRYHALTILAVARARHEAVTSYERCIQFDPEPTA